MDELFPPSPPAGPGNGVSILELESLKMGRSVPSHSFVINIVVGQEKSRYQGRAGLDMPMKVYCNVLRGMRR